MARSSHAPAVPGKASAGLRVTHEEQHGSQPSVAKARAVRTTRVQAFERLAAEMERAGVSDYKAEKATGYSRSSIARMRRGEQRVDSDVLLWAIQLPDKTLPEQSGSTGGETPTTVAQPGSAPVATREVAGSNPARCAHPIGQKEPLACRLSGRAKSEPNERAGSDSMPPSSSGRAA
jgi:hypothetical protein